MGNFGGVEISRKRANSLKNRKTRGSTGKKKLGGVPYRKGENQGEKEGKTPKWG